jgi:lysophospholipase L1-like esterase
LLNRRTGNGTAGSNPVFPAANQKRQFPDCLFDFIEILIRTYIFVLYIRHKMNKFYMLLNTGRDLKNKLKILAVTGIITIVTIMFIEIVLRLTDPLGVEYFSEVVRYFKTHITKEDYSYIHPAGMDEKFQGVTIRTNSHGLRGPEFEKTKPEGKRRILLLGDSVVLGWGVEYEETFPALLQNYSDRESLETEVIPAGVSSWNTRTEYEYLRKIAIGFEPDIVILVIVSNDTDPKENSNIEIEKEKLLKLVYKPNTDQDIFRKVWFGLVDVSYLFRHLQFMVKVITEKDQNSSVSKDDPTWKDAELALTKMSVLCDSEGIKFIPFFYADEKAVQAHPIYRLYTDHFKVAGINYHTFPEQLFTGYRYQNSVIDNHPNAEGHKIIAKSILDVVKGSGFDLSLPQTEEK